MLDEAVSINMGSRGILCLVHSYIKSILPQSTICRYICIHALRYGNPGKGERQKRQRKNIKKSKIKKNCTEENAICPSKQPNRGALIDPETSILSSSMSTGHALHAFLHYQLPLTAFRPDFPRGILFVLSELCESGLDILFLTRVPMQEAFFLCHVHGLIRINIEDSLLKFYSRKNGNFQVMTS